jgi:hypothetical protein
MCSSAGEVDAQHLVPVVHRQLPDGAIQGDAGVVDEDVEAAVTVDHLSDDAQAVIGVAHVAVVDAGPRAAALELLEKLLRALAVGGVPGCDDAALGGEATTDRGADAAAAAGDERHAAFELHPGAQLGGGGGDGGVGHGNSSKPAGFVARPGHEPGGVGEITPRGRPMGRRLERDRTRGELPSIAMMPRSMRRPRGSGASAARSPTRTPNRGQRKHLPHARFGVRRGSSQRTL